MKKFLLAVAFAITGLLSLWAQTYYTPSNDIEVIYTTVANLETADWAVDIKGEKNYAARTGKKATINPETDTAYDATQSFDGIYIKEINTNAGRSIIFYITGITEFKAYACDDKATSDPRYVEVTYNAEDEDAVELAGGESTVNTEKSSVITISGLDAAKKYCFHVNANNKDMCLYAIKLTKGVDVEIVPELVSIQPQDGSTDVEIEQTISFTYSIEVNTPSVTINDIVVATETSNDKTFTIPYTLANSTTYTVVVGETTTKDGDTTVAGKTWSFTTEELAVSPVELTTDEKTWDVSAIEGEVVVDATLYFSNATQRTDGSVRMNRASGGVYMMFALPANVSGKFTFSAKSSGSGTRTIKYLLSSTFDIVPSESEGVEVASVVELQECAFEVNTSDTTYVFVYNTSGNTDYYNITWTPVKEALIASEKIYYLRPATEEWTQKGWTAANFTNVNTGTSVWVKGEYIGGYYLFYLSQYNVSVARAKSEELPMYTHVNFVLLSNETTEMTKDGALATTGDIYYDDVNYLCYNTSLNDWEHLASSAERVEMNERMVYVDGVVRANGTIEVYSTSGIKVSQGVDLVDIRMLNRGIYVVRCGDTVRPIVR